MAYDTTKPPVRMSQGIDSFTVWAYQSADAAATVKAAGYISNAKDIGMKVGDLVLIADTGTPLGSIAIVSAVATSGATLA
ncbi:MAG TPA: hypothetical protein VFX20_18120 [Steroidobacteraceae bacterium]|nr:hypothetical protein [Steroidobacteraceae bacterium]